MIKALQLGILPQIGITKLSSEAEQPSAEIGIAKLIQDGLDISYGALSLRNRIRIILFLTFLTLTKFMR